MKKEAFGLYEIQGKRMILIHWSFDYNYLEGYLGFSEKPMVILSNKHFEGRRA